MTVIVELVCKYSARTGIANKIRRYIIDDPEIFRDLIANLNFRDRRNELHERRRDKAFVEFLGIRKEMIL